MKRRRFGAGGLILSSLILGAANARGNVEEPARLVLTTQENGTVAESAFNCRDKIHGYLTLAAPVSGRHVLEGRWYGPAGVLVQRSETPLNFSRGKEQTAYLWLAFDRVSALHNPFFSPSRDVAQQSFSGQWQVVVYWDGTLLMKMPFNVHCVS